MSEQLCPCCAWINIVPDQADDAFVACPECGQMLKAPEPWSSALIPICDTRPMIAWPAEAVDPSAPMGAVLVPWVLTCQMDKVSQHTPRSVLSTGISAIVMGIFFLTIPLWEEPGKFIYWFGPLVGLLALSGGIVSLRTGLRKISRRTPARVVYLAESLPAEAEHLGSPVALHQVRVFWRLVHIGTGILLCIIAGVCGGVVLSGQVMGGRIVAIAILGWPVGLYMIWQGMGLQGKRILVFTEGVVTFDEGRTVVCRWDQIERLWMALKETGDVLQRFVLTLERHDGEKLVFTPNTEYIENQFVARVQYEHCACMLPSMQASLDEGETLDFGPVQVGREGVRWNQESLRWNEIRAAFLEQSRLRITGDQLDWAFDIGKVPNLTILLALIRQRVRHVTARAKVILPLPDRHGIRTL